MGFVLYAEMYQELVELDKNGWNGQSQGVGGRQGG